MLITKWKKLIWKGYLLYDSNYLTFWKMQNYGNSKKKKKKSVVASGGGKEGWVGRAQIFRAVKLFCDPTMTDICHRTIDKTHRMYNTNDEL